MKYITFLLWVVATFCFSACNKENKRNETVQLIKEWSGKEILFPDSLVFTLFGKDFVCDTIPVELLKW